MVLGVVLSCDDSGCTVRLVPGNEVLHAAYGSRVLNAIRVRPRQLVAIDRAVAPPEVVWRWMLGEVTEVAGASAAVQRADVTAEESRAHARKARQWARPGGGGAPVVGERVYFGAIAGQAELACRETDIAAAWEGVGARWFRRIEAAYSKAP